MTQNKNKKGIAKKALSISLVAAMLATSNVPVWASGFEAVNPAAEGFTVESAAPEAEAVDSADDTVVAQAAIGTSELTPNFTVNDKKETSVKWGDTITVAGDIIVNETGKPLDDSWNYVWQCDGVAVSPEGVATDGSGMSLTTDWTMSGKTLNLYLYNSGSKSEFQMDAGISVNVEKRSLKSINISEIGTLTYDGFSQELTTDDIKKITVTDEKNDVWAYNADYFTVAYDTAVNAGEDVTITASATSSGPFIGTASDTSEIQPAKWDSGKADQFLVASVDEGLSFEYTGDSIRIPVANVHLNESKTENDGADNKFNGADLSSTITYAEVDGSSTGDKNVTVHFDGEKVTNIKGLDKNSYLPTTETVEITKRDLTNTDITLEFGSVLPNSPKADIVKDLQFSAGGTEITFKDSDFNAVLKDENGTEVDRVGATGGTYTLTISATKDGNAEGSKTIQIPVVSSIITAVTPAEEYSADYTGSAIEPKQEDFGDSITIEVNKNQKIELGKNDWKIIDYENNINASETDSNDDTAYAIIEITEKTYAGQTVTVPFTIKQLSVAADDVTVPESVTYNKSYKEASEYGVVPTIVAKNDNGKVAVTLSPSDYKATYEFSTKNDIDQYVKTTVEITNDNFKLNYSGPFTKTTKIVAKALEDSMIQINPSSYTYTGGAITPEYNVIDGSLVLWEGEEFTAKVTDNVNVGTGKLTITATDEAEDEFRYHGSASATFEITPADINSVKVEVEDQEYTGRQVRPTENDMSITLNGNDVSSQFEISAYGSNVEAGTGTLTLVPTKDNKNFTGTSLEVEFNIIAEKVKGTLSVYNDKGIDITSKPTEKTFQYDGTAKTFAKEVLSDLTKADGSKTTATVDDFEIKYVDNVTGAYDENGNNTAYVYAVAKAGTGFAGDGSQDITTADGTVIKGVVAKVPFTIKALKFTKSNVVVENGVYAGGLPVGPEVLVQYGGKTLVEGQDYELVYTPQTETTVNKPYTVTIKGIGGYSATNDSALKDIAWGIDKKDLADCDVTMANGVVTVKNGVLPVAASEYTTTTNSNGSVTVTAASTSKNYTGSVTVFDSVPETPGSTVLSVSDRTTSTVTVDWDKVDGAEGYTIWYRSEYDTEMSRKIIFDGDQTSWTLKGLQPGTKYFFAMRSWVKDSEGKYVFSDVSPTQRGTTKPLAATIIAASAENGKIKVKLAGAAEGAEMYSMCYGDSRTCFSANDFKVGIRTQYTTRTLTPTFEKGTYYVCVKSYRDLGNNKRVYGAWSNTFRVVVK